MGAAAVLVAAMGSALLLYVVITATVLCRKALQGGGEFEAEIKARLVLPANAPDRPARIAARVRSDGPRGRAEAPDQGNGQAARTASRTM